ncbi:MAG: iron-sulfur cluster assembly accessory protein [Gammaproteobacteria bacterium]|nr:iron-sulfur cluster assembly accessory protein [Gammaproteobacteria bacterium]
MLLEVTTKAAQQIRYQAKQNRTEGMPLRIAAKRNPDGSLHYGMGFDDTGRNDDTTFKTAGIDVVISPMSLDLLSDTVLDYVQLDDGKYEFIYLNPNDPNYKPPEEEK